MTPAQVEQIASAGGQLIVTPHADAVGHAAAKRLGLLAIPGFFTPTEAFAMLACGADALKLFPSEAASPTVLRSIRAVLPPGTPCCRWAGSTPRTWRPGAPRARPVSGSARRSTSRATRP